MLVKDFPEFFASYNIYEIVDGVLKRNFSSKDVDKILNELMHLEAKPNDFISKLGQVLRKHTYAGKASKILMDIKERLGGLIATDIVPKSIEMTKDEKKVLKVLVENRTDAVLKFRVGVQQIGRAETSLLYDAVKNYCLTKLVKSHIIQPKKVHAFKFYIKPDVFGIHDLYDLKKKKKIKITLGMQAEADGVDGLRTTTEKVDVNIVQVKL